jgi:hypothetical protein
MKAQCFVQVQHTNELCFGDCNATAQAFPVGQAPYTYNWTPGNMTSASVTGLCAGTYTVTVTDANACVSTSSFTVTQPPQLQVLVAPQSASCSSCCDGYIVSTAFGGTPPYAYAWSNGQTTPTDQSLCPGTYTLCVTDANGCVTCDTTVVNFATGINNQSANGNLDLFPNPATNFVTVKETVSNSVSSVISITNVLGETVFTKSISGTAELNESINISGFDSGIYFISVKTSSGTSVRRFVKE